MSWEKVRLGDVTDSCLGKMLDQHKNKGDLHPYLANINVRWGNFELDNLPQMRFEDSENERYGIQYGDLIVCEGGEPGRCAIWKEQIPNMKIQKALHRIRVHDCLDYRYLYYWFLWAGKRGELEQYFTGSTIKHMPGEKLKSIVIDMPPLNTQRYIASILSAYDDLIENNQKQIKLLEEAAQRLYKEWFVDLRFPGWEKTKIVDGVPEGWERLPLPQIADIQYGFAFDGSLFNSSGYGTPIVRIRNIPDAETSDFTSEEASSEYLINNGDIIVGMDGEFHINSWAGGQAYLVQRTCCIRPKIEKMRGWLLYSIHEPIKYFEKTIVGATVAHLGKKHLDSITLLLPTEELYAPFISIFDKRQILMEENIKLREVRDRLIYMLMSTN